MSEEKQKPVEVPQSSVSADALSGIIDEFILREGTDYGASEALHETKVNQIRRQLQSGDVKIFYDFETETVSLVTKQEWSRVRS